MHPHNTWKKQRSLLSLCLLATGAAAQPAYTVQDLGTLGGFESLARSINNFGQAAGRSLDSDGLPHAFRTAPSRPISANNDNLGSLGGPGSSGFSINIFGQVVGTGATPQLAAQHAFRTGANLPINPATDDLGVLSGSTESFALDINNAGQVAGYSVVDGNSRAFRTAANQPINPDTDDLGTPLGGDDYRATGINNLGHVAGSFTVDETGHAFLQRDGVMTEIAVQGTGPQAVAGINDLGQIALTINSRPFIWKDGQLTDLGAPSGMVSLPHAINITGQVIGEVFGGSAFLYRSGVMHQLNDLIPPQSGWVLDVAYGINDLGQIVGYGRMPGNSQQRAFRLDPSAWTVVSNMISAVEVFNLDTNLAGSLTSSLNSILTSIEQGRNAARNQLNTLQRTINDEAGGNLSNEQAELLSSMVALATRQL